MKKTRNLNARVEELLYKEEEIKYFEKLRATDGGGGYEGGLRVSSGNDNNDNNDKHSAGINML